MTETSRAILYTKETCPRCPIIAALLRSFDVPFDEVRTTGLAELPDVPAGTTLRSFPVLRASDGTWQDYYALYDKYHEPILEPTSDRFVMFPIRYPDLWDFYKKAVASFWTADEIDLQSDLRDWIRMTADERHFIKYVLAFFAASDGIVNENLCINFANEVQISEARAFYAYQEFNETIHSETYSLLIDTYVTDPEEKTHLFRAIEDVPAVRHKAEWAMQWMSRGTFPQRLVAFACVEGILFSGSFCALFWLRKRGLMPGLTFSNELIARDEGMHYLFAAALYKHLNHRLDEATLHEIVRGAVEAETFFITEALPCKLIGMNADLMKEYIRFVADSLCRELGAAPIYGARNVFDFMEMIDLSGKTSFFERRVGEYAKHHITAVVGSGTPAFSLVEDF